MKCIDPYQVEPKKINGIITEHRHYHVPCGKCVECKKQRVKDWTFRLFFEERVAKSAYFVTLTYDTRHVPMYAGSRGWVMSLSKPVYHARPKRGKTYHNRSNLIWKTDDDLTRFFKKLRRHDERSFRSSIDYSPDIHYPGIKYYACGEYGDEKQRPHYHAIIFNLWDPTSIGKAWKVGNVGVESEPKAGAFAYTAKYIDKDKRIPFYEGDPRRKEYSVMSKGIGDAYLTPQAIAWHRSDPINHNFVTYPGRKDKQRMPRYYYEKIFDKQTRLGLSQYWEVESLINENKEETEAQKRNLTLWEAKDQKKRYIEKNFNFFTKNRNQWQRSVNQQLNQK